jgi:hypothetical protein
VVPKRRHHSRVTAFFEIFNGVFSADVHSFFCDIELQIDKRMESSDEHDKDLLEYLLLGVILVCSIKLSTLFQTTYRQWLLYLLHNSSAIRMSTLTRSRLHFTMASAAESDAGEVNTHDVAISNAAAHFSSGGDGPLPPPRKKERVAQSFATYMLASLVISFCKVLRRRQ